MTTTPDQPPQQAQANWDYETEMATLKGGDESSPDFAIERCWLSLDSQRRVLRYATLTVDQTNPAEAVAQGKAPTTLVELQNAVLRKEASHNEMCLEYREDQQVLRVLNNLLKGFSSK